VITQLKTLSLSRCSRCRLEATAEVNGDVSILTGGSTFYDVATSLEAIKGVTAAAGLSYELLGRWVGFLDLGRRTVFRIVMN